MNFAQHIIGIENGILTALKADMTGVNSFGTYSGDLDSENLKRQIASFAKDFPRVLVSYTNGRDMQDPKTSIVIGRPIHFRHDCTFAVIVAANDARSDQVRRRGLTGPSGTLGTYEMIAKVREKLTGLMFRVQVGDEWVSLTNQPLLPVANEYVLRIPNVTAYAVMFRTYFRWVSTDRTVAGIPVEDVTIDVESLMEHETSPPGKPGVEMSVG